MTPHPALPPRRTLGALAIRAVDEIAGRGVGLAAWQPEVLARGGRPASSSRPRAAIGKVVGA